MHHLQAELFSLLNRDDSIFTFIENACLDGLWFWDLENPEHEWMSETFWRTLGFDPNEKQHLASEWQDLIYPDDFESAIKNFEAHCADPNHPYDQIVRYLHKDGSTVWIRCRGMAIRDDSGKPIRMLGAHLDITDLKRAELVKHDADKLEVERYKIFEAKLKQLERVAAIGTWEVDLERGTVYWSDQTRRIHEVEADYNPILEEGINFYEEGESRDRISQIVQNSIETGAPWDVELNIISAKGRKVRIRTQGEAEISAGKAVKLFGVFQDISARYAFEQELQRANQEAERANKLKSEFLANMSHEIRTPMNAVLGLAQVLAREGRYSPDVTEQARKILRAGQSLQFILNDILDFSKIDSGKLTLSVLPMRLEEIEENLSLLMGNGARDKEVEFIIQPSFSTVVPLLGDQMRLEQILINLVGNAIKFTDSGYIKLESHQQDSPETGTSTLRFAVTDTGIGMNEDQVSEVLKPFVQADSSISRRFGGTGLGLTIAQRLLDLMGSKLEITSQLGVGSTFAFTLQLPMAQTQAQLAAITELPVDLLVVDDQQITLDALALTADTLGWTALKANGGQQAVDTYRDALEQNQEISLVLMDWMMPEIDGVSAANQIKALAEQAGVKRPPMIIMVTAYNANELETSTTLGSVDLILNKPITRATLKRAYQQLTHSIPESVTASNSGLNVRESLLGKRIMVVDDNLLNREVAKQILTAEDADVIEAVNGQQAVEALTKIGPNAIDIILMDVQMPIMNGLEATRLLRSTPGFERTKIIGMSAAAYQSDIRKALVAGMDAYLTKPINVDEAIRTINEQLASTTARSLDKSEKTGSANDMQSSTGVRVAAASSLAIFDLERARAFWRSESKISEYLQLFAEEFDEFVAESSQSSVVPSLVHKLKGSAGTLYLDQLRLALESLDKSLKEKMDIANDYKHLIHVWLDTRQQIIEYIERLARPGDASAQIDTIPLSDLKSLAKSIESYNPEAVLSVLNPIAERYSAPLIEEIRRAILVFEFDQAAQQVDQAMERYSSDH